DVPHALAATLAGCLERDLALRFQSAADLAEALAPFGSERAHASAGKVRRTLPSVLGAVKAGPTTTGNQSFRPTSPPWSATGTPRPGKRRTAVLVVWAVAASIFVGLTIAFVGPHVRPQRPAKATASESPPVSAPPPSTTAPSSATTGVALVPVET